MRGAFFFALIVIALLLTSCAQDNGTVVIIQATEQLQSSDNSTTVEAVNTPQTDPTSAEVTEQLDASQTEAPIESTAIPATTTPLPEPTESSAQPIEVTYFTPAQTEGPYYTVEKPADRDNDLTVVAGASGTPAGEVIEFGGKVYDATGIPVSGAVIEIWQTDTNGVYLHPNDPGTVQRDRNFQFYGEAVTEADGSYDFRTILPGHYEPRPRHIHVKVRLDGQELLTTQFYFEGDPELANESMFNQTDSGGEHLIINLVEGQDVNGNPISVGQRDIVLSLDFSR